MLNCCTQDVTRKLKSNQRCEQWVDCVEPKQTPRWYLYRLTEDCVGVFIKDHGERASWQILESRK